MITFQLSVRMIALYANAKIPGRWNGTNDAVRRLLFKSPCRPGAESVRTTLHVQPVSVTSGCRRVIRTMSLHSTELDAKPK